MCLSTCSRCRYYRDQFTFSIHCRPLASRGWKQNQQRSWWFLYCEQETWQKYEGKYPRETIFTKKKLSRCPGDRRWVFSGNVLRIDQGIKIPFLDTAWPNCEAFKNLLLQNFSLGSRAMHSGIHIQYKYNTSIIIMKEGMKMMILLLCVYGILWPFLTMSFELIRLCPLPAMWSND